MNTQTQQIFSIKEIMLSKYYKAAILHLEENHMTYWQHLLFAMFYGLLCFVASIYLVIHAIAPCFFQTAGSDLVQQLAKRFNKVKE